jgi:hypothetical protein
MADGATETGDRTMSKTMILCRSDAGDGGWSLYPPGTTDDDIASGNVLPLLTGEAERDEDGGWSAPTDADYERATAILAACASADTE